VAAVKVVRVDLAALRAVDQGRAHVVGQGAPGQQPRVAVDHGGQVQVGAVEDMQVRGVSGVAVVWLGSVEVSFEQVKDRAGVPGRDGGVDLAA